jgi:hypothetical protein
MKGTVDLLKGRLMAWVQRGAPDRTSAHLTYQVQAFAESAAGPMTLDPAAVRELHAQAVGRIRARTPGAVEKRP